MKIITATLHNVSPVPNGSIYQGGGMFEFVADDKKAKEPYNIQKKYAEYDIDKGTYYKDPAVKVELTSDLIVAEKGKTEKIIKVDKDGKAIKPVDPKDPKAPK